jgi:hypothetical protein
MYGFLFIVFVVVVFALALFVPLELVLNDAAALSELFKIKDPINPLQ